LERSGAIHEREYRNHPVAGQYEGWEQMGQ